MHDDKGDEVDGRGLGQHLRVVRLVFSGVRDALGHAGVVGEPHRAEGDAFAAGVPVGHGEAADGLLQAEEDVGVEEQAPVDELVLFDVAGLAEKDVGFGLFVGEHGGGGAVGQAADHDHKEGAEDLGKAEDDAGDDGPELGEGSGWQEVDNGFLQVVENYSAVFDCFHDGSEGIKEDHISCFNGNI